MDKRERGISHVIIAEAGVLKAQYHSTPYLIGDKEASLVGMDFWSQVKTEFIIKFLK